MNYAIYHKETGAIDRIVQCPRSQAGLQAQDGESCVTVGGEVSDDTHYINVDNRQAVRRGTFNVHQSVQGLCVILRGLPNGAVIDVRGMSVESDGHDEIEFDVPGTYRIDLHHPHYLDETMEVTVG